MTVEHIAYVAYEANKAYRKSIGNPPAPDWEVVRAGYVRGVEHALGARGAQGRDMHSAWARSKLADGWAYGETESAAAKTHPNLVPWENLPSEERAKDELFISIVHALGPVLSRWVR